MKFYAGIDLHSNNNYVGIMDDQAKRIFDKRLPNDLALVLKTLERFKNELYGVVVESTFNWYWLVDGLQKNGYKVHLANPAAIKQYEGKKFTDDKWDSFWLADMLRLDILPEGHIYPIEGRPVRDLVRRRLLFVKHRTAHILSLKGMISRYVGKNISKNKIYQLEKSDIEELFDTFHLRYIAQKHVEAIHFLNNTAKEIEKEVLSQVKLKPEFKNLLTIPGIGNILGITIMLEVGDIRRFKKVGNYSSYCRCVKSERLSNDKKKGKGNTKNGNKYLAWAYVEASQFSRRFSPLAQRFYQRKMSKSNRILATKALCNKLARASFYIMRDQVPFNPKKLFI